MVSVRPDESFGRAVSRRDLVTGPALKAHLLWGLSTIAAVCGLLVAAALVHSWLSWPSTTAVGFSPVRSAIESISLQFADPVSTTPSRATLMVLITGSLCFLAWAWLELAADSASRNVARGIGNRLRRAIHRQHLRVGPADLDGSLSTHAETLATADTDLIETVAAKVMVRQGRDTMIAVSGLVLALLVDPLLALQCLILPASVLAWLLARRHSTRLAHSAEVLDLQSSSWRQLGHALHAARQVTGYGFAGMAQDRFAATQAASERARHQLSRHHAFGRAARGGMVIAVTTVILFLVSRRVLSESSVAANLSIPCAMVLLAAIAGLLWSIDQRGRLPQLMALAAGPAGRIFEFLDRVPGVSQAVGARFVQPLSEVLKFDRVTWQSAASALGRNPRIHLRDFDLTIPAGEAVALLSVDPRESRAVAWLTARFIDPHGGRVLVDGQDIATGTLESLRNEVLMVSGDRDCLAGSVLENVLAGRPELGLNRATEAAKIVHAHHFISKLPQGYETYLDESGNPLDAGQRFRVALARALSRDPALMVIEEPEETLDDDTKALLADAYDRITAGRTVLFLPTRLSTVRRADRVVLIHNGQVAEDGCYDDLVRTSDLYRHWEYTRFNEFQHERSAVT